MKGVEYMNSKYVKFCPVCNKTRQNMDWCDDERLKEFSKGFHNVLTPKEGITICPSCKKGVLEDSILTHDEFNLIEDISNSDRQFLEAMIELKKNDIIEYQLKLSQFKNQLQQQENNEQAAQQNDNTPHCPTCGSTNVEKISVGKKVVGGALFGLFSSNVRKTMCCKNCGYKW